MTRERSHRRSSRNAPCRGSLVPFFAKALAGAMLRRRTTGRCPCASGCMASDPSVCHSRCASDRVARRPTASEIGHRSHRCRERRSSPRSPSRSGSVANHDGDRDRESRGRCFPSIGSTIGARGLARVPSIAAGELLDPIVRVLSLTRIRPCAATGPPDRCTGQYPTTQRHLLTNLVFPLTQMTGRGLERWEFKGLVGPLRGHLETHRTYPCDTRPKSTTLLLEDVAIRCVGHTRGRDEGRGVRSPRWIGSGGARREALRFLGSRSFPCFRGRSCSRRCSCSRARSSARGRTQARGVA